MIESLSLQNFQAHRKLRVEFGPGITTIVGRSDVGKSAIIRALRWAATNQPGGDQFITTGTKGTSVALRVDGRVIKRKRGGSVNTYHLDAEEYKSFGRGVPGPIVSVLNMPGVCWQGQHDAPFWFSETGGEVARKLNSIVNLAIIDTTLASVQSENHAGRVRLRDATEKEKQTAEILEELDGVPTMALAWHGVELAFENLDHKRHDCEKLKGTVESYHRAQGSLAIAASMADSMAGVASVAKSASKAKVRAEVLRVWVDRAVEARTGAQQATPETKDVRKAWRAYREAREFRLDIIEIIGKIRSSDETYQTAKQQAEQAEQQVRELGICPTCKR